MSLTGKLAKIAIGIAVAKGVKKMMGGNSKAQSNNNGLGDILGQLGQASQGQSGGLGSILGQLGKTSGGQSGGLSDLLGQLAGGQSSRSSGGLGELLGSLAGAASSGSSSRSGLGGVLGGLLGGGQQSSSDGLGGLLSSLAQGSGGTGGNLGGLLGQAMNNFGEPETAPSADDEHASGILLSAMLQAAKADGQIDDEEKTAIMKHLDDATPEEMAFIQKQLNAPVNPEGLAQEVPNGMQQQAYAMSLLAIDLDNQNEAKYLDTFAKSLNLNAKTVNGIHSQMNEPALYS